ncbi:hypothetical protein QS306_14725 [Paraburkholderia bonniea]|uniref:hypothetical protein n=1 Tax=Paraburkholderia bonniea TaxID=2152891 RepID=UPI001291FA04|nr:hypothetical protein [Paraburkholderia bonniea]WJF92018.1 hypothetical protein QS306_14725 [Paraburkholderia bonniea]WJF95338.1 hypothetical protein QS308_14730 [Paraburkholderia bonniea]
MKVTNIKIGCFLIDVVIDRGVVEHHYRRQTGGASQRDLLKELHDIGGDIDVAALNLCR